MTRRQFAQYAAAAAGALAVAPAASAAPTRTAVGTRIPPSQKLRVACFAVGGKGWGELTDLLAIGEHVVALCDVDREHLEKAAAEVRKTNPDVRCYTDYRKLLEKEAKHIDAVTVSTPDHMHAPIAIAAIQLGKHAFVQKPLTRSIAEARRLREAARQHRIVSQMGNQGSSDPGLRRGVELLWSGIIGKVREAHVWTNRPIWPQGIDRPEGSDPVPPTLDWDCWLGVAPERPFKKDVYHPFKWRGWHDFGTGALGDMGCHTLNLPFRALKLGYACEVEAEVSDRKPENYPASSKVRFLFPERTGLPAVNLTWYDGGWKPNNEIAADVVGTFGEVPKVGCLLIGEKGVWYSGDDNGTRNYLKLKGEQKLVSITKHEAALQVKETLPRLKGEFKEQARNHMQEWVTACKGGPVSFSNFEIAAYLTEIILVGCVAIRAGKKLIWDGPKMRATNAPEADQFVNPPYRKGWA